MDALRVACTRWFVQTAARRSVRSDSCGCESNASSFMGRIGAEMSAASWVVYGRRARSGAGVEIRARTSGLCGFGLKTCSLHGSGPTFGSPGAAKRPSDYRTWARNRVDYTCSGRNRVVRSPGLDLHTCSRPGPPAIRGLFREIQCYSWA